MGADWFMGSSRIFLRIGRGMWYAVESLQELVGVGVKVMGILLSLVFVVLEMEFKVSCMFGKYYNPEP